VTNRTQRTGPKPSIAIAVALLAVSLVTSAIAAPRSTGTTAPARPQTVDWMSPTVLADLAESGIAVFVPSTVPDPFYTQPSVDSGDGYYSLYWVIPGTPPTYLRITGERGGSVPEYSYYDRRTLLEQNATVLDAPAWRDQTPIYDMVYVIIDDVLYSVESRNLPADSSLSIAGNLIALALPGSETSAPTATRVLHDGTDVSFPTPTPDPLSIYDSGNSGAQIAAPASVGSGKVITITVDGITSADLVSDGGRWLESGGDVFAFTGPGAYEWQAPLAETATTSTISVIEPATGQVITSTSIAVVPPNPEDVPVIVERLVCPERMPSGGMTTLRGYGSGQLRFRTTDGIFPAAGANWHFAGENAGLDAMDGVILVERDFDIWLQPNPAIDVEYTLYVFAESWAGDALAECGIIVEPPVPAVYPQMGITDGTGGMAGIGFASFESGDGSNVPMPTISDGSAIDVVDYPIAGQTDTGDFLAVPANRRDPDDPTPSPTAQPGRSSADVAATPTP